MAYTLEHFGSSLGSWTAITAGTGTMVASDHMAFGTLNASSDAAAIYKAFDHTKDQIIWMSAAGALGTGGGATPWPALRLVHSASAPACGARSTFNILAQHTYYTTGGVTYARFNYAIDPTGTNQQWQESSQSFTTGGSVVSMPAGAPVDDFRLYGIEWDATNGLMRLLAGHTASGSSENADYGPRTVAMTDWVSLSSILNGTSSTLYLVLGWPENNFYTAADTSFGIEWVSETSGTRLHVLTNGKATVGSAYNITHSTGFDFRAPYFVPGTRGQIAIGVGSSGAWDDNKTQWGSAIIAADGKYVASYCGDAGGTALQIGIATATTPYGPWTKDAGNPLIPTTSSTDYAQYMRFNVLVEDWSDSDATKRYKMIVNMTDASTVTRTGVFYASAYSGSYTYGGRLLEDDATETQIAFRGQPVWYGGLWYLFYNATVGGVNTIRYATGTTLRAGGMTKANVTLSTEGQSAWSDSVSSVSGRVWTVTSTTGAVKDMLLVVSKTSSADTYGVTRIRKVINSTQIEVYHSCPGTVSGSAIRSSNYGTDNALNHVILIDGVWHFIMTTFKAMTSHPSYSAHHESNSVFTGGAAPTDSMAINWMAAPIVPMGRDSWNTTISNENIRFVHTPLRIYTLTAAVATFALTGVAAAVPITRLVLADEGSFAANGVDVILVRTGAAALVADPVALTMTGSATALVVSSITPIGSLGIGISATASTTLACSTTQDIPSYAVAILQVSGDNLSSSSGQHNEHLSVTDSGSGIWTKLAEETKSSGAPADGVTVSAWVRARTGALLPSASTVTVLFDGSPVDKVCSGEVFITRGNLVVEGLPSSGAFVPPAWTLPSWMSHDTVSDTISGAPFTRPAVGSFA